LVEQQVRIALYVLPPGERARLLRMTCGLHVVVQVLAYLARTALCIAAEELLQLGEQVRLRPEVTEALIATGDRLRQLLLHPGAIVAMEAVALDEGRLQTLAAEDLLEGFAHRSGASPRGACDCDDRMTRGHG